MARENGRNEKCECGSGLKRKRCPCLARRPRTTSVLLDYGQPVAAEEIHVDQTGIVSIRAKGQAHRAIAAHLQTTYERTAKSPKVVHLTPLDPAAPGVNPNLVLERFDLLLAIDTSTAKHRGGTVSFTCVVQAEFEDVGTRMLVRWQPIRIIEFRNIAAAPENTGWRYVLESIAADPDCASLRSIGIIVDSDFGRLSSYNAREQPISENFYLPERCVLMYASADTGSEYVANKMIARADESSRALLRRVISGDTGDEGIRRVANAAYTGIRIWNLSPEPTGSDPR